MDIVQFSKFFTEQNALLGGGSTTTRETARPQGPLVAVTTADQTVTDAGWYRFTSYYSGYYLITSNTTINSWPGYNNALYVMQGSSNWYYLEAGDHFRGNSSSILYQRFA